MLGRSKPARGSHPSMPGGDLFDGLARAVVFVEELLGTRLAGRARRELRPVRARNRHGHASLEFLLVEVTSARRAVDVAVVMVRVTPRRHVRPIDSFAFFLGQALRSLHPRRQPHAAPLVNATAQPECPHATLAA